MSFRNQKLDGRKLTNSVVLRCNILYETIVQQDFKRIFYVLQNTQLYDIEQIRAIIAQLQ